MAFRALRSVPIAIIRLFGLLNSPALMKAMVAPSSLRLRIKSLSPEAMYELLYLARRLRHHSDPGRKPPPLLDSLVGVSVVLVGLAPAPLASSLGATSVHSVP